MTKVKNLAPGVLLCLVLAVPCWLLGKAFPVVGGPVFAILAGMVLSMLSPDRARTPDDILYTPHTVLP